MLDTLMNYDIFRVFIDQSATGDVFAAVPGKRIVVVNWYLAAAGNVVAIFRSATTDIGGAINAATVGAAPGEAVHLGHFQTEAGEPLNLELGSAINVKGYLVVALVPA